MNVEKIKGLIEVLKVVQENNPDSFNVYTFGPALLQDEPYIQENIFECKTTACIAGWTCLVYENETDDLRKMRELFKKDYEQDICLKIFNCARNILELDELTTRKLFNYFDHNDDEDYDPSDNYIEVESGITATHAIAVLENLIKTGEVDWKIVYSMI